MATARERLMAEQALARRRMTALQREFDAIAEAAGAAGTDDEHDPEGATLAFERQHTAALLGQAREQLAAVEAALDRLETGRYGECARCGQPIGKERLAARPAALTCIRCAARLPHGSGGHLPYSARSAEAVRVRAAQPAGIRAPPTAMTRPDSASRTSSTGW
jgi:DnaK suppressor protein